MEDRGDSRTFREQNRNFPQETARVEGENISEREQRPHQVSQDIARSPMNNFEPGRREGNGRLSYGRGHSSREILGVEAALEREKRPHQAAPNIVRDTGASKANRVGEKPHGKRSLNSLRAERAACASLSKEVSDAHLGGGFEKEKEEPQDKLLKTGKKISEVADEAKKTEDKPTVATDKGADFKKSIPYCMVHVLLKQSDFCVMEDQLYLYCTKGYWKVIIESEANREIRNIIPEDLRCRISKGILYEIYEWLRILAPPVSGSIRERRCCLNFLDVAYNWDTEKAIQNRKELMFKYMLQLPLQCTRQKGNGAYKNFIKDTFGNDEETIREFRKFLGLCLSDIRDLKLCFFLYGPSNSGKTVVLNLLKKIVGEEWCSSVSFTQMSNEFAITQLLGKRLNLSGEVSGASNKRLDILKSLTGNDNVTASYKGKDHFQFRNESLLIFACNSFPSVNALEEFDSFLSRVIIFPFSNVVHRDKWIENLEEILLDDAGNIITEAIVGLRELKKDGYCFKESPEMKRCKQSFKGQYNSFALYADEHILKQIDGKVTSDSIRSSYKIFCDEGGYAVLPDNVWSQYLQQRFGCQSKIFTINGNAQGERKRGYQGIRII